jgi:uncharacterized protein YbjQ (UPF0145 family)
MEERFMNTKIFNYGLKELNTIKFIGTSPEAYCENLIISDNRLYRGENMANEIIVVSTPYVPGHRITKNLGFTWGLVVRSRGLGGNFIAGLRTIFGGEIHEYTDLLNQSRQQALSRLKENARLIGANAIISVDFDSSEIGQTMTEVLAMGTAVIVEVETMPINPVRLE